ncbi:MAG TPA: hypothetical protein VF618_26415 [Thermoanaerobaculia bacterium]
MKSALAVAFLALASAAHAQQQQPQQPQQPQSQQQAAAEPDVAIFATVRARELRFEHVPNVRVTVTGSVNGTPAATVSTTDRQNLPDPVQPYVTYRDIGIVLTITSTLPNIEQILDEALGTTTSPPVTATEPPPVSPKPTPKPRKQSKR